MGLISPTQLSDGTTHTAADHNNAINTIANEFNGNIDNANIKAGAAIDGSKLASNTTIALKPQLAYKFSGYRAAALTPAAGGVLTCDTEEFDTGSNFDIATNKGRFTAPIAGFYFFTAATRYTSTAINQNFGITLNKNGSVVKEGSAFVQMFNGTTSTVRCNISAMLQLAANDYVEAAVLTDGTEALNVGLGSADNYFQGYLVSV